LGAGRSELEGLLERQNTVDDERPDRPYAVLGRALAAARVRARLRAAPRSVTPWYVSRNRRPEAVHRFTDTAGDVEERFVPVSPGGHWLTVGWQGLEFPERGGVPVDRSQDDRDDPSRLRLVTLHRPGHLDVVTVIRGDEVRTDQEQDDVRGVEVLVDLPFPLGPGPDASVVPPADETLTVQ
jgi:hypothetical protein